MKTIGLSELVAFLNAQNAADFKGNKVDQFLTTHHVEPDDFVPFIYFHEDTYCRNLVFKNELFELLVLTWLPMQRTAIQDLGGSRNWMIVQSGSLTYKHFRRSRRAEGKKTVLEPVGGVEVRQAGPKVYSDAANEFHSLANLISKPAVSVHVYAAPLPECQTYSEETQTVAPTALNYFHAFGLVMDPSLVPPDDLPL